MEQRQRLAEQLKKKMPVGHRSTERIVKEEAYVWQVDERELMIEFKNGGEGKPEVIKVQDIDHVKQTDYPEDNSFRWVLGINHKDKEGKVTMLQFNKREDRDIWVSGLRSFVDALRATPHGSANSSMQASPEVPTATLQAVTDIALMEPPTGSVARVCLTLASKEKVYLDIPEGRDNPQQLKSLVQDFVEQNSIMTSESTSLYRLLRTVMQRIVVSRETQNIINEISSQRLDLLLPKGQPTDGNPVERAKGEQVRAEKRLKELAEEIPRRIGDQGTAAPIVSMILKRNIEKMQVINDMIVKARAKELDVQNRSGFPGDVLN